MRCGHPLQAVPTVRVTSILLNPPRVGGGGVTRRSLNAACKALGATDVEIVNLVGIATRDLPGLNDAASEPTAWLAARRDLTSALVQADGLLFGWGLGGFRQPVRDLYRDQVRWMIEASLGAGHVTAWMMDGAPRHPSRWPQYLGPVRGRFLESTFEGRVASALRSEPLDAVKI